MTSMRVTRCPKCQTAFRVTPSQLRLAGGAVRCGSCLAVFDAIKCMPKSASKPASGGELRQVPASAPRRQAAAPVRKPVAARTRKASFRQENQTLNDALVFLDIDHDELENVEPLERHRFFKFFLLSFVFFLGLLLLLVQYAWFNMDRLAMDRSFRPAYQLGCEYMNCTLPTPSDIESLRSLQLHVRSHPRKENGLLIDSVIINEADFSQPWPLLELVFTDLNGQVVASRQFRAREYLGGELANSKLMPSGQPVRLGLEIVDPGIDAVNYRLRFVSSKGRDR